MSTGISGLTHISEVLRHKPEMSLGPIGQTSHLPHFGGKGDRPVAPAKREDRGCSSEPEKKKVEAQSGPTLIL